MQPDCIWKIPLKAVQHKLVWWLVDAGAAGNVLLHGWQAQASRQMNMHRLTIHRNITVLIEKGIVIEGAKKGEVTLNTEVFRPQVDTKRIRKERYA